MLKHTLTCRHLTVGQLGSPSLKIGTPSVHVSAQHVNIHRFRIVAIEIPGGSRNLNMNINDQQAILNAYIVLKAD